MNQKQFILSIVIIVVAFLFVIGGAAIYASMAQGSYQQQKNSYSSTSARSYDSQTIINQYYQQQQPVQPAQGTNCNQQVTGYYNNQPQVDCVPSGSAPGSYSKDNTIKIYVQTSGSYYPYQPYYPRYYFYPRYYPYPKYPYPYHTNYWW